MRQRRLFIVEALALIITCSSITNNAFAIVETANMHVDGLLMIDDENGAEVEAFKVAQEKLHRQLAEACSRYSQVEIRESIQGLALQEGIADIYNRIEREKREFIDSHPDSYYSAFLLASICGDWSYEEKKTAYEALSPRVQASAERLKKRD